MSKPRSRSPLGAASRAPAAALLALSLLALAQGGCGGKLGGRLALHYQFFEQIEGGRWVATPVSGCFYVETAGLTRSVEQPVSGSDDPLVMTTDVREHAVDVRLSYLEQAYAETVLNRTFLVEDRARSLDATLPGGAVYRVEVRGEYGCVEADVTKAADMGDVGPDGGGLADR
jgi:hypothetical protein